MDFPSWCCTTIRERYNLFCCGQGHFYDNSQKRTGFVGNTASSRASRHRKVEHGLIKKAVEHGVPTCNYELDILLRDLVHDFSQENVTCDYIDRCLNAWTFPAGIRTGFNLRYETWCPLTNTKFVNMRKSHTKRVSTSTPKTKTAQKRVPFPSKVLPFIAEMVQGWVERLERDLPKGYSNLWQVQGSKWLHSQRADQVLRYQRVLQHACSGCFAQPHRSGEHSANTGASKLPRLDRVTGKFVDIRSIFNAINTNTNTNINRNS